GAAHSRIHGALAHARHQLSAAACLRPPRPSVHGAAAGARGGPGPGPGQPLPHRPALFARVPRPRRHPGAARGGQPAAGGPALPVAGPRHARGAADPPCRRSAGMPAPPPHLPGTVRAHRASPRPHAEERGDRRRQRGHLHRRFLRRAPGCPPQLRHPRVRPRRRRATPGPARMNPASPPATPAPLLSIVVLVYNTSAYLRECFDSLLHQAYRNIEIIAIDDASTDDSLAICREYEAAHPNFSCISKPNEGGAIAGNLGISLARGEYVALVDSDDVVTPDGYRLLMEEALRTGADITIGRAARLVDGARSAAGFLYEPYVWSQRRTFDSVEQFDDVIHDCFYWNKVFRTGFLRAHGLGMDPGLLYADRPFVHRAYWHSRRTAIIPDLVYLWRT